MRKSLKQIYLEQDKDQYGRTQADRDWEQGINPKTDKKSTAQNSPSQEEKVKVSIDGEKTDVTINYKPGSSLQNVQISWGEESHTVDFEYEDTYDDHGNEGMDTWFTAESEDGKWKFGLEVYVEASFHNSGNIGDWDWDSLEIEMDNTKTEGTCGYSRDGKPRNKPATPLNERFQQLAGLKPLYENNFDQRLAQQMGMSDDEFEDQVASRDVGSSFPGDSTNSLAKDKARDLIASLRKDYRDMDDEDLDEFSKEMVVHFLDNTAAQAAAKIYFGKRGI